MPAILTIKNHGSKTEFEFHMGDNPSKRWLGIKPDDVVSVELYGEELQYAITTLGATKVDQSSAIYFGDEAKRIYFNW